MLTRRKFLEYSTTSAIASAFFSDRVLSATPPNILLIIADDLGQHIGCYGDTTARTPNINRLATQGIRFANSYVTQASCSPSRSSIYTGLYPHQTGFFPPNNDPVGQIGLAYPGSGYAMNPSVITMQQLLKQAGYRIGHIGKLHVAPEISFPFDYRSTAIDGTRDVELIATMARQFLAQRPKVPSFLTVCYFDPHEPYVSQFKNYPRVPYSQSDVVAPAYTGRGNTLEMREKTAGMYNGIARMDAGVGMLLWELTQLGLYKNTIVIFTGDNGPYFPRAKITCYEAGLRVPLIVRYPGRISPNRVDNSLVSTVDILPTVLQAAGLTVPRNLAGRSLMQLFRGNTTGWRGLLAAEYTSHTRELFKPRRCIRGRRYKYILNLLSHRMLNQVREELYDLSTDAHEFKNLAGIPKYQERQEFLRGQLLKWRQETADPLLNQATLAVMEQQHYGDTFGTEYGRSH